MKGLKKLLTGILAATMIMGSCLTVSAAETTAETGTITISGADEEITQYDFYRVLDFKKSGDKAGVYSISSKWAGFFSTGDGKNYLVAENTGSLNEILVDGAKKYLNITESNVVNFTNAAMKYALENNVASDATATDKDTVTGLDFGYYLMIPVGASIQNGESSGSIASIDTVAPTAEIIVKAKKPSIEKEDNQVTVDVGQTVEYKIKGKVPNTKGFDTYTYKISDEMTPGLTYQKNAKVSVGGTELKENFTIENSDDGFVFTLTKTATSDNFANLTAGAEILIEYTAVVNENAIESTNEINTAQLKYGRNPEELEEGLPVKEEVYSAKIIIDKIDGTNTSTKLAGAQFALINSEGKYYHFVAAKDGAPAKVEWVDVANAPAKDTSSVTDAMAKTLATAAENGVITAQTTDANGAAEFKGIKDGIYYLVEFKAPDGYNRLAAPQSVTVTGNDVDVNGHKENVAYAGQENFDEAVNGTAVVKNNTGSLLPATGGIGTTIFYILGGILIVAGAAYFIVRRKANAE